MESVSKNETAPSEQGAPQEQKASIRKPVPEISIIIPEYKADLGCLFENLSLINAQTNFNFFKIEVIVVDDASPAPISTDFFKPFSNLAITVANCAVNGGPGRARQVGIDIATGEYVMFIDADDSLKDTSALSEMVRSLESLKKNKAPCDILLTDWEEEIRTAGSMVKNDAGQTVLLPDKYTYAKHESDATWMHGKLYRRQFLIDNDIRFDDLRVHEDRRFNILAFALSDSIMRDPVVTYIWKYHPDSITRAKGAAYSYNSIGESVDAAKRAYDELRLKHADRMDLSTFDEAKLSSAHKFNPSKGIVQTILYTYFIVQSWIGRIDSSYLLDIEGKLAGFYVAYKDVYDAYPYALRCADYAAERNAVCRQMGNFIEKEDLAKFLWRIQATKKANEAKAAEPQGDAG